MESARIHLLRILQSSRQRVRSVDAARRDLRGKRVRCVRGVSDLDVLSCALRLVLPDYVSRTSQSEEDERGGEGGR